MIALASQACVAIAVLVAVVAVVDAARHLERAPAELAGGTGLVLQFLTAAGLLRLASHPGPAVLALTLFVIVVRKVTAFGLSAGRRALG